MFVIKFVGVVAKYDSVQSFMHVPFILDHGIHALLYDLAPLVDIERLTKTQIQRTRFGSVGSSTVGIFVVIMVQILLSFILILLGNLRNQLQVEAMPIFASSYYSLLDVLSSNKTSFS